MHTPGEGKWIHKSILRFKETKLHIAMIKKGILYVL